MIKDLMVGLSGGYQPGGYQPQGGRYLKKKTITPLHPAIFSTQIIFGTHFQLPGFFWGENIARAILVIF
jgi:hypothetical protein